MKYTSATFRIAFFLLTLPFVSGSHGGRGGASANNWLSRSDPVWSGNSDMPDEVGKAGTGAGAGAGGGNIRIRCEGNARIDGHINADGKKISPFVNIQFIILFKFMLNILACNTSKGFVNITGILIPILGYCLMTHDLCYLQVLMPRVMAAAVVPEAQCGSM